MKSSSQYYSILNALISAVMSYSIANAVLSLFSSTTSSLFIAAIIIAFSAIWYIMFYNKKNFKITLFSISAIIALVFLVSLPGGNLKRLIDMVQDFFIWCTGYINGYENPSPAYQILFSSILSLFISLVIYIFTIRKNCFIFILAGSSALFVYAWASKRPFSFSAFYLYLLTILIYYLKNIYTTNYHKSKNDYAKPAIFILWIGLFCSLVFMLSYIIPASSEPIQWNWLDQKVNSFIEKFYYSSYSYFSLESVGFGDSAEHLGGPVYLDDTHVLNVKSPRLVYLRGASHDFFNGSTWKSTDKETLPLTNSKNSVSLEQLEIKTGMKLLSGETGYINRYFYNDNIEITYQKLKTKSIFSVNNMMSLTDKYGSSLPKAYATSNGTVISRKKHSKDFSYNINSYNVMYNHEGLKDILRKSYIGYYRSLTSIPSDVDPSDMDMLIDYSDNIYKKYLQLPENLSDDVKNLAVSITKGYTNNYDKAKAIEEYLVYNYTYTLDPKPTSEDSGLLDYFLFTSKEGYCSYYATAMAVLARCAGIPSRYVEGYILPEKTEDQKLYHVTNEQAHAWTEIYFEGYGWLIFEPSTAFYDSFYTKADPMTSEQHAEYDAQKQLSKQNPSAATPKQSQANQDKAYSNPQQQPKDYLHHDDQKDSENIQFNNLTVLIIMALLILISFTVFTVAAIRLKRRLYLSGSAVTFVLLLISLFIIDNLFVRIGIIIFMIILTCLTLAAGNRYSRKYYEKLASLPSKDLILSFYKYFIYLLKLTGNPIEIDETALQYCEKLKKSGFFYDDAFSDITSVFVKTRYGNMEPDNYEKQLYRRFYSTLNEQAQQKMPSIKYFIFKYLFAAI